MSNVISNVDRICNTARALAFPEGTPASKYKYQHSSSAKLTKYDSDRPTKANKEAFDKVFPKHWSWGSSKYGYGGLRTNACCDDFVAVVVRYSGVDKNFPHSVNTLARGKYNSPTMKKIKFTNKSQLKRGDVVVYMHAHGGHAYIYMGDGKRCDAALNLRYGAIHKSLRKKDYSGYTTAYIYRPTGSGVSTVSAPSNSYDEAGIENGSSSTYVDTGDGISLPEQIDKLYSSNNYEFIYTEEEQKQSIFEDSFAKEYKNAFKQLSKLNSLNSNNNQDSNINDNEFSRNNVTGIMPDGTVGQLISKYDYKKNLQLGKKGYSRIDTVGGDTFVKKGILLSSQSLVEAPVIVLKLGGKIIGGYGNDVDMYPNYIQSLTVEKISGRINKYTINLLYQVRYGEDPNLIDKLLSMTGFTKKINIVYGDSNYPSGIYRDDEAIITDVTFNEDVSSKQIKYTITALSSIISSTGKLSTYPSITDKPSNCIRKLLYSNTEESNLLLDSLSGMKNKTLVDSKGLIPNDDTVITTQKMINASTISMLNYYVSGMYNSNTNTSYFYTIHDDVKNEFGGPYIKIYQLNETDSITLDGNYFEVDVGFPSDNFVMGFSVNSDVYFPLVYDYNSRLAEWTYDINNSGELVSQQVNPLLLRNNINRPNVVQSTWWNKVTEYPITASLTLKGLTKPVIIGSYIKINVLFYGNKDLASGLYMITGQTDSVSGSGCRTTLNLVRVGT